jgi:hypothetical protein
MRGTTATAVRLMIRAGLAVSPLAFPPAGQASFHWSAPAPILSLSGQSQFRLSCATASLCVAVELGGQEVTFDPASPAGATHAALGGLEQPNAVICLTVSRCTAVDTHGHQQTFNPAPPVAEAAPVTVDNETENQLAAVACPSESQCTAISYSGSEVTFDPVPDGTQAPVSVAGNGLRNGLACPTASECVAADSIGNETTFDPISPGGVSAEPIDPGGAFDGVACPTASECVAIDAGGRELTFDPASPGSPSPVDIDDGKGLAAVACPAADECVAVDGTGVAVAGDPRGSAMWTIDPIPGADDWQSVACPTAVECVAVDDAGQESTGRLQVPVHSTPPTIAGRAAVRHVLSESHGSWSGSPTSYTYQWQDCDRSGAGCVAIAGATGQSYTAAGADLSHTIRVQETAANAAGPASPASSAATAEVMAAPGGSGSACAAPKLRAALRRVLVPRGKAARVKQLLKAKGFAFSFAAPCAGRLVLRWYSIRKGNRRPIVVGSASSPFKTARRRRAKVKLTAAGSTWLRRSKRVRLTAQGSFTPAGGTAASVRHKFTVRR